MHDGRGQPAPALSVYPQTSPNVESPVCFRDCVLAMRLETHTHSGEQILAVRNWFHAENNAAVFLVHQADNAPRLSRCSKTSHDRRHLEACGGSATGSTPCTFGFATTRCWGPSSILAITEPARAGCNYRRQPVPGGDADLGCILAEEATTTLPLARDGWTIAQNCAAIPTRMVFTCRSPTRGAIQPIRVLSEDPLDRNYLRVDPASIKLPDGDPFSGALPPSPAEGDWFTQLQERWKDTQDFLQELSATTQ